MGSPTGRGKKTEGLVIINFTKRIMQYEYQDLETARPFIRKTLETNRKRGCNTSVKALFRNLRKKSYLSFFEDWPIIWVILDTFKQEKEKTTPSRIQTAIKQSKEYSDLRKKEKTAWLRELSRDIFKGIQGTSK